MIKPLPIELLNDVWRSPGIGTGICFDTFWKDSDSKSLFVLPVLSLDEKDPRFIGLLLRPTGDPDTYTRVGLLSQVFSENDSWVRM